MAVGLCRLASGVEPKDAGHRARGQRLIVWCLSSDLYDRPLQGTEERARNHPGGGTGWNRARSAPRVDQTNDAPDAPL